jgi:hypothetical protein
MSELYTDEVITSEEQIIIDSLDKPKPFNILSMFGITSAVEAIATKQVAPFNLQRRIGIDKEITITNISGKDAYVILTPAPIKSIETIGIALKEVSFNVTFTEKGEYKPQQLLVLNNTKSDFDLDNSQFYYTLFLHIDNKWKKVWENRRINGEKYNINILERHIHAANVMETVNIT